MALDRSEREALIDRYAEGPSRLKAALAKVPAGALQWRPKAGEGAAHEVGVHCADSETNGTARIRDLAAEPDPVVIQGYDEAEGARRFHYHRHPPQPPLAAV